MIGSGRIHCRTDEMRLCGMELPLEQGVYLLKLT